MPFAGMSPRSPWPIGPSKRASAVLASRKRKGRSSTWMRGKNDSRNPVVWNAMSTMPVCMPDTILTSLPSWPPENTWMRIAPPGLAATSSENFVATAWVGCSGVSGWPSLRVTAPWAKARPDREIAGMARPAAAIVARVRSALRAMFEVMDVSPAFPAAAGSLPVNDQSFVQSQHAHGSLLNVTSQHGMQTITRRDVDRNFQFFLKKLLDADQIERIEFGVGIVVDEEVEIAGLVGLVACCRTKEIKRRRAHGPDRLGVIFQLGNGFGLFHTLHYIGKAASTGTRKTMTKMPDGAFKPRQGAPRQVCQRRK